MPDPSQFEVAVIGGGPAGLMAAEVISERGVHVTVYDRMPTVGRKLLMAGRGGLNLTHGEALAEFMPRFGAHADRLRTAIEACPPEAVRTWCEGLGQTTFVGSSGRVFPKAMKASPLLRAWLRRLGEKGVVLRTRQRWHGWDDSGCLVFTGPEGPAQVRADATVLALGGASWPGLGSDGGWVDVLAEQGVQITPLQPANCGFHLTWSRPFIERCEGLPLKRISIRHDQTTSRGELVCTATGLEGGALYALSANLREAISRDGAALIHIDLKPDMALPDLARALEAPRRKLSMSSYLRKTARLSPVDIALLQEAAHAASVPLSGLSAEALAAAIKAVPLTLTGAASMARAISTAGGVAWEAVDSTGMLSARPGVFVAGEMLDWEAPTGGYLLQACFSTGVAAGKGVVDWLNR